VTIAGMGMETFRNDGRDQDKLVISFKERIKSLVCNPTNYDAISDIAGTDETENWPGVRLELFADKVQFRRELVNTVRVRKPPQAQQQVAGNGQPPRPAASPQPPELPPGPPLDAYYEDDVPYDR
jgi:hypothetical protein